MIKRPALRTVVRGAAVALCATACAVALTACGGEQAPTQEEAAPQEEAAEAEPEGPEPVAHTNDLYDLVAIEEAGPEAYEQNIVSKLVPHTNPDLQGGWDGIVVDDPTFIDGITLTDSMINYDDEYSDGSCEIGLRFDGDVEGNIDAIANEILIRTGLASSGTIYADPDNDCNLRGTVQVSGEEWWWRVSVGTAADSKSFDGSATIEIRDYGDETSGYESHADLMDSLELHDFYVYET